MNLLKVPGAMLSLGCAFLSTGAKAVWGLLQPPFRELGLKAKMVRKNFRNWNTVVTNYSQ